MDGFEPHDNVIVIAATNRGDLLDPALMRPGRFDRRIVLELPDLGGRKKILKIHKKGKPFSNEVEWERVAKRTVGFSGADLENMLNEAAIWAERHDRQEIIPDDLEEAAMKVKLGPEKKRLQSEHERKMTAYHEAGHAIVTHNLEHMDPVHRVSIVSRGKALGYTLIPPERDRHHETRSHMLETITSLLGGRAAENMIFDDLTSGAASDIERATQIVRRMVIKLGMSDLGPIHFGKIYDKTEWGEAYVRPSEISDEMRAKVDEQINNIIESCYNEARKLLKEHKDKLDELVNILLEKETVEQDEFEKLMNDKKTSSD
jgi:cell division protease FtsH